MPSKEDPSNSGAIDQSLLARLNALRPSTVSLSQKPSLDVGTAKDPQQSGEATDLAKRFAKLGSKSLSIPMAESGNTSSANPTTPDAFEESKNIEDNRTFDELVTDIGQSSEWNVDHTEVRDASGLMNEAKSALASAAKLDNNSKGTTSEYAASVEEGNKGTDLTEDQEAEDYVQRVLAEIELERQQGYVLEESDESPEPDTAQTRSQSRPGLPSEEVLDSETPSGEDHAAELADTNDTVFDLPSAPTAMPISKDADDTIGLDALLPSAPSSAPSSSLPTFASEEIDTWCIICNDDASVRCLGCDGDLYCSDCWNEGHKGSDAGFEERRHKAIAYVKPKPSEKGKKSKSKQRKVAA